MENGPIAQDKLKQAINALVGLLFLFEKFIKHLDPECIVVDDEMRMKVVPQANLFTLPNLAEVDLSNIHVSQKNDVGKLNLIPPEVVEKLLSRDLAGNEDKFRKLQQGQVWWDLGVVLYRMSTGLWPYQSNKDGASLKLLPRYPVPFPRNLRNIDESLKELIRSLMDKKKKTRLGVADKGGVYDVLSSVYLTQ